MIRRPPRSTFFPSTALFRSHRLAGLHELRLLTGDGDHVTHRSVKRLVVVLGLADDNDKALDAAVGDVVTITGQKPDRKSTRLNSSHGYISYAVFCLKTKTRALGRLAPQHRATASRRGCGESLEPLPLRPRCPKSSASVQARWHRHPPALAVRPAGAN